MRWLLRAPRNADTTAIHGHIAGDARTCGTSPARAGATAEFPATAAGRATARGAAPASVTRHDPAASSVWPSPRVAHRRADQLQEVRHRHDPHEPSPLEHRQGAGSAAAQQVGRFAHGKVRRRRGQMTRHDVRHRQAALGPGFGELRRCDDSLHGAVLDRDEMVHAADPHQGLRDLDGVRRQNLLDVARHDVPDSHGASRRADGMPIEGQERRPYPARVRSTIEPFVLTVKCRRRKCSVPPPRTQESASLPPAPRVEIRELAAPTESPERRRTGGGRPRARSSAPPQQLHDLDDGHGERGPPPRRAPIAPGPGHRCRRTPGSGSSSVDRHLHQRGRTARPRAAADS